MTDKPSPPPPSAPWMVALAKAFLGPFYGEQMPPPALCAEVLSLIQKHALPASSAREERLEETLGTLVQLVHLVYHTGPQKTCRMNTCAEARKALEEKP